jgi:putative ABC transport system ATP-binding protein
MSLLTLQDVSMAYNGKVLALQHIDLTVEQGEWLAIMGPSGSGKTTLMNIIGCMDHATSGHIVLDTVDLMNVTNHELTQLRRDKDRYGFSAVSFDSIFDGSRKYHGSPVLS